MAQHKRYGPQFKLQAAKLVVDSGYTFAQAASPAATRRQGGFRTSWGCFRE